MTPNRTVNCAARLLCLSVLVVAVFELSQVGRAQENDGGTDSDYFEAPLRLMVGDTPLNTSAKQMYPSPAVYDVDSEGKVELVVGDIFGSLRVYENENDTGKGDPVWSKHVALKTADGDPIKVSNW
jgi:hypothetical protein